MIDLQKHLGSHKIHDPALFNSLMDKQFNAKIFDGEISYRTVNYWEGKGYLLSEKREENETEWRKLSFVEYMWIRMLDELRKMGVTVEGVVQVLFRELGISQQMLEALSIEKIEKLRGLPFEKLLTRIDKTLISVRLCLWLVNIVTFRTRFAIRVFKNGEYSEHYGNPDFHGIVIEEWKGKRKERRMIEDLESFISISISGLINDFIETKDLNNIEALSLLSREEAELVSHIRNKDLKEITVTLAEGIPTRLELTEVDYNADIQKRIYEDMMGSEYVELSYSTNTKKQVTFRRTTKVKLN